MSYKVTSVNDSTLQILQDWLENTIFIHRAILTSISRSHCENDMFNKEARLLRFGTVRTRNPTEIKKRMTTPKLSTKLCDMLAPNFASNMWYDSIGTVRRTIPRNHPTTYFGALSTRTGGDSIDGETKRP